MSRVHVYLDVDGVLNAVTAGTPQANWSGYESVSVNQFGITYAPELVARVNALAAQPNVRMHWLTTWESDAATELSPSIGLDGKDWPVVGTVEHYSPDTGLAWWKLLAIRAHLPADVEAVWIDDDITYDREARDWLDATPRVRWVSPNTSTGITRKQMDRIDAWCTPAT